NEPSSFVTPSKTTAVDSSQKEDISPSTVEAAQILTGGKLDPSKISKSHVVVAQRSVHTFVPATGPLPSIERQRDLDDMIASFSNTEWMILMARVKDYPEVAKEILGADRYRAQQAKPMTRGDTVKFMRTYIKNMSAAYYSSGRIMEWANKFKGDDLIVEYNKIKSAVERSTTSQGDKRSGPTLEPGSPKKMKSTAGPSLGSTSANEVPADTGVSIAESVPADQRVPADQSVPVVTRIPAGTCVSAKAATITIPVNAPLDEDEPAEESSSLRRQTLIRLYGFVDALSKNQPLDGLSLSLWGDLNIMLDTWRLTFLVLSGKTNTSGELEARNYTTSLVFMS
nr:hypothetical protein [Tanacetum cinerariifolium]